MYNYSEQKKKLFTDEGQRLFLKVWARAQKLLDSAGAFRVTELLNGVCGDSWLQLACIDRLVELEEIQCVSSEGATQHHIYRRAR